MFKVTITENVAVIHSDDWREEDVEELIKTVKKLRNELSIKKGLVYIEGELIYRDNLERNTRIAYQNLTREKRYPYWMD